MQDQTKIEDVLIELDQSCYLCNRNMSVGRIRGMCSEHLLRIQKIYATNGHSYPAIDEEIKKRNLHVE